MKILFLLLLVVVVGLVILTRFCAVSITRAYPPTGSFVDLADNVKLHYKDYPVGAKPELPPIVFIHGASGNLRDLEEPLADQLKGRGRLIFVDRPGLGYSSSGDAADIHLPTGQARVISQLLKKLEIEKAVIVGHSYGGSVAAAFAVNYPQQTAGLVFLSPATHPWPGAGVTWHYDLTNIPVIGFIFSETLAIPAGHLLFENGVREVFKPNKIPENYLTRTGVKLLLRPDVFRNNAKDVGSLYDAVVRFSPRYKEISVPTSIITGDSDDVVLANVHSTGLKRDIKGSKIVWLKGVGHSPAWTNPDRVIAEIERVASETRLSKIDH